MSNPIALADPTAAAAQGGTNLRGTAGAAHVVQAMASGQARNREIAAQDGTATTLTWTEGVTEMTVTVIQEAAGTAELRASIGVCFDAPSTAVATAWLTHADSTSTDSNMYVIQAGESRTFYFSGDGITRMDVDRLYGSEALGVFVEAA